MSYGGNRGLYQTIWNRATPLSGTHGSGSAQVGLYFIPNVAGRIVGASAYVDATDGTRHTGWLCQDGQSQFLSVFAFLGHMKNPTTSGWVSGFIKPYLRVTVGATYLISVCFNNALYRYMVGTHTGDTDSTHGVFTVPHDTGSRPNGATQTTCQYFLPTSMTAAKPAIDVLFLPD